jgi:hypothetical protein
LLLRMPEKDIAAAWRQFVSDLKEIRRLAEAEKKRGTRKAA